MEFLDGKTANEQLARFVARQFRNRYNYDIPDTGYRIDGATIVYNVRTQAPGGEWRSQLFAVAATSPHEITVSAFDDPEKVFTCNLKP